MASKQLKQVLFFVSKCYSQPHTKILSLDLLLILSNNMKIILLLLLIAIALAESCGGNCPSGKCPSCPCGSTKSVVDIATWCSKHSWNQNCCKCIASHESGGNSNAANYNSNGTFDVGLWQINHVNWAGCNGGSAPCGTNQNLNCAIKVYSNSGNSWRPWSTHTACGC